MAPKMNHKVVRWWVQMRLPL